MPSDFAQKFVMKCRLGGVRERLCRILIIKLISTILIFDSPAIANNIPEFHSVLVNSSDDVRILVGLRSEVMVPPELTGFVKVDVVDGRLMITPRAGGQQHRSRVRHPIVVSTTALDRLELAGSGDVTLTGPLAAALEVRLAGSGGLAGSAIRVGKLTVQLDGSGSVRLTQVVADRIRLSLTGAGDAYVAGGTKVLAINATGAGDVDAAGISAANTTVRNDGPGTVKIASADVLRIEGGGPGRTVVAGR